MIAGTLRLSERDGTPLVVDENGDTVVCRGRSQRSGTGGKYHHIDAEHFATTGEIRVACSELAHYHDQEWVAKLKTELDSHWDGCSFTLCFGEYDPHDSTPKVSGHTGLAARLDTMSVAEFDAAVAAQQARPDGGER